MKKFLAIVIFATLVMVVCCDLSQYDRLTSRLTGLSVQRCYSIFYKVRRKMHLSVGDRDLIRLLREKVYLPV